MFVRDYQREYAGRDLPTLKRQRGRAYEREIAKARELGLSIRAMRRTTRPTTPKIPDVDTGADGNNNQEKRVNP